MEEVDRSRGLDDILKECGRSLQSAPFILSIHPQDQGLTYLLVESRNEKVSLKVDPFSRKFDLFRLSAFLNSSAFGPRFLCDPGIVAVSSVGSSRHHCGKSWN